MEVSASFLKKRSKKLLGLSAWGVCNKAPLMGSHKSLFAFAGAQLFSSEKEVFPQ
jgi:hypothetical protein